MKKNKLATLKKKLMQPDSEHSLLSSNDSRENENS